jgi:hypothetical protein
MSNSIPPAVLDSIIPATSLGLSRLGWVAPVEYVNFEQWMAIMDAALAVERASPWWVGDLFNHAQAQGKEFEDRALQALPYKDQTVRNYAVVARVFPITQRRSGLTIKHHAVVSRLARTDMSEAQRFLELAETTGLSASETRQVALGTAFGEAEPAQIPPQSENTDGDASLAENGPDWRDALLVEAAEIMRHVDCYHVAPQVTDWLTRYNEAKAKPVRRTEAERES